MLGRSALAAVVVGGLAMSAASLRSDDAGDRRAITRQPTTAVDHPPGIESLTVTAFGETTAVEVVLADRAPVEGSELFFWRTAGRPFLQLRFTDGVWNDGEDAGAKVTVGHGTVRVEVAGDLGGIAVSTTGGDREPDVGLVEPSAAGGAEERVEGAVALAVETAVATAQAGFGALDPHQRELATSLLGRQLTAGTTRLRATTAGVDGDVRIDITVLYPTLSQVSTDSTGRVVTLRVDRDEIRSCDGASCTTLEQLTVPATAAAAMVANPSGVTVTPLPDGEWNGKATTCAAITSILVDGPTPGRTCWLDDGTIVEADRENGFVVRLLDRQR